VFLIPAAADLELAMSILKIFEGASGLACNMSKCQLALIQCEASHIELATQFLPCSVTNFPLHYLGIPLSVTSLLKAAWQRLIYNVADKLPPLKGKLMHKSGRLTLIKSTLAAVLIHSALCLELPAWVRKALVKIMHVFLWTGNEAVQSGKCAVAWASLTSGSWGCPSGCVGSSCSTTGQDHGLGSSRGDRGFLQGINRVCGW
jgi:hypothetical protein